MPKLLAFLAAFPAWEEVDLTPSNNSCNLLDILRHFTHHLNGFQKTGMLIYSAEFS